MYRCATEVTLRDRALLEVLRKGEDCRTVLVTAKKERRRSLVVNAPRAWSKRSRVRFLLSGKNRRLSKTRGNEALAVVCRGFPSVFHRPTRTVFGRGAGADLGCGFGMGSDRASPCPHCRYTSHSLRAPSWGPVRATGRLFFQTHAGVWVLSQSTGFWLRARRRTSVSKATARCICGRGRKLLRRDALAESRSGLCLAGEAAPAGAEPGPERVLGEGPRA